MHFSSSANKNYFEIKTSKMKNLLENEYLTFKKPLQGLQICRLLPGFGMSHDFNGTALSGKTEMC